jgi:2-polyprenyl-3-methyl-5-hydroxy-6-metoxy-1,4-benzoquinol methylase
MKCRFDGQELVHQFVDLGHCPPSNSYLSKEGLQGPEVTYPLKAYVSERTFYVQVPEFKKATEIFTEDYAYFSSFSTSWLKHSEDYVKMITERFGLGPQSFVVEVASNDGYLLQYFKKVNVPCLGIEPSMSVAKVAKEKGVDTQVDFFSERLGKSLAQSRKKADLILGNNVFPHVPDVNDFVKGLKALLAPQGLVTLEFQHLLNLIEQSQFDTIYHEHYSYFSLYTVEKIVGAHGLEVFDVDEIGTHGGSLRVYLKHQDDSSKEQSGKVAAVLRKEESAGLLNLKTYLEFSKKAEKIKIQFLKFLIEQKEKGKKVAAYGAAAKGNTLLNFSGVRSNFVSYVVDASPHKQGRFLPGSHIPIVNEQHLKADKPDYVVILPWNLKTEITGQLSYIKSWGGQFVVAIPELTLIGAK